MIPNKALGQHFLTNQVIIDKIISLIKDDLCENILEIGPGKGGFTFDLGQIAKHLLAVEKDPHLHKYLCKLVTSTKSENIELVNDDILTYDFSRKIQKPLSVFGSLPYNQSKDILKQFLLLNNPRPKNLFFIVQKEVAKKYLQKSPYNNYYSVIAQLNSEPKRLFEITPGSFTPPPKVDSTLVKFELKELHPNYKKLTKFVEILYKQPRKTVRNNLDRKIPHQNNIQTLNKRPSELTIEEIETLFLLYNKSQ